MDKLVLYVDDKISENYYNLSSGEVRFTYIYPNHFERIGEIEVVLFGSNEWIHISKELDRIGIPYKDRVDFVFTKIE